MDNPGKGAFYATDFDFLLKNHGIKHLIICGVSTEVCVNSTVREANDRGYEYLALEDCVASYFPEFQEAALKMIKAPGGIFGRVTISTQFLDALNKPNPNDSWVTHKRNSLNSNANRPFVTHRPSLAELVMAEGQIRAGNNPA